MSLTRDEWIEMWGSLKIMERNNLEMTNVNIYLPPSVRKKLRRNIFDNNFAIKRMKDKVQSVIGQME